MANPMANGQLQLGERWRAGSASGQVEAGWNGHLLVTQRLTARVQDARPRHTSIMWLGTQTRQLHATPGACTKSIHDCINRFLLHGPAPYAPSPSKQDSEHHALARRMASTGAPPMRPRQQWQEARKSRHSATNNQSQLTMPAVPQMQAIPPGSPQSVCCLRSPRQTRHTAATRQWQALAQRITKTIAASYFGCG